MGCSITRRAFGLVMIRVCITSWLRLCTRAPLGDILASGSRTVVWNNFSRGLVWSRLSKHLLPLAVCVNRPSRIVPSCSACCSLCPFLIVHGKLSQWTSLKVCRYQVALTAFWWSSICLPSMLIFLVFAIPSRQRALLSWSCPDLQIARHASAIISDWDRIFTSVNYSSWQRWNFGWASLSTAVGWSNRASESVHWNFPTPACVNGVSGWI